jgi:hypothetical protein
MRAIVAPVISVLLQLAFIISPAWSEQSVQHIILTDGAELYASIVSNDPTGQRLQVQERGQSELRWIPYQLIKAIIEDSTELDVTTKYIPVAFLPKQPPAKIQPAQSTSVVKPTTPEPASAPENGRLCYIRASVGFGTQSLDDLNSSIESDEQFFQSGGIPASFDTFGGALDLGAELGFRISRSFSIGFGLNYQKNEVTNTYSDVTGSYSDELSLGLWDVSGNMSLWFGTGLFLGGSAGMAFGNVTDDTSFVIYDDPSLSYSISSKGDGKGFSASAFGGYQATFASGPVLFAKLGYAYRNISEFDGSYTSPEFGTGGGTLLNNSGSAMEFDFSGIFACIGIGIAFGKSI